MLVDIENTTNMKIKKRTQK